MSRFASVVLELSADEEERLCADLWDAGSIGMECRPAGSRIRIEAYFRGAVPTNVARPPDDWLRRSIRVVACAEVPDRDWMAAYRESAVPFAVGGRWWIDPREPEGQRPDPGGRIALRIPARRAFGVGTHVSTRLILEWLETLAVRGRRVLDLGTGTGILALACERLGARGVVAVDIDPVATVIALETRKLNAGTFPVVAGSLDCLHGEYFDLALVNILPTEWIGAVRRLGTVIVAGGVAVFSGIPSAEREGFEAAIRVAGFRRDAVREREEWVSVRAVREAA